MTVSDFIFEYFRRKGTDTVFMVSGSSAMWLTDALARNEKIQKVCNLHEQAAVMAADCYSKVNERLGVALVTVGPGATNAITGVAEAYEDSSSVIVVSGDINSKLLKYEEETGIRQNGTQGVNLRPLVSSITKYFEVISDPKDAIDIVETAYREATTGRLGPVWIDVPVNVQNMQIPDFAEKDFEKVLSAAESEEEEKKPVEPEIIEEIIQHLKNASRPLVYAGQGVRASGACEDLLLFCKKYDVPVVTSRMGIDVISSDSPYFVGRPGAYGNRAAHFALQNCDFLFVLGCRLSVSSIGYYPDRLAEHAWKAQIDIDELELQRTSVPIDLKIHADAHTTLKALLDGTDSLSHTDWRKKCSDWKEKYPAVTQDQRSAEPLNTYYVTEMISRQSADKAAVVVDTGTVCNVVSQSWQVKSGQRYLISGGLSCMGYWAGAIGACAGDRRRQVIAITGDGSLQMNIQEFGTLKQYAFPLKLFVYNNNGYLLIKHNQHNYMHDRFLGVNPDSGVYSPDVSAIAEAYGLQHVRIDSHNNIEEQIAQVLETEGPVICEVICDDFQAMMPRLSSKVMPDGSLKASEFDDLFPFLPEEEIKANRHF